MYLTSSQPRSQVHANINYVHIKYNVYSNQNYITTHTHTVTYYKQNLFIGLSLEMTITDNEEGGSK